ncbi:hypothetical protein [Asticcacaulis biprosthecium]|nr:hypothetical protein [Asticcacaulis biprosthecium]
MSWFNPSVMDGPVAVPMSWGPERIDEESGETVRDVTAWAPGYHLNVAPSAIEGREIPEGVRVYPESPSQAFAGADTVFLRFADEAAAAEFFG